MLQLQIIILTIVSVIAILITLALFFMGWRSMKKNGDSGLLLNSGWSFAGVSVGIGTAMLVISTLVALIPFNATYWTYNHVDGKVSSVSNRFVDGTGDLSGDFVLKIAGHEGVYNVQDNRIQGVKIGDHVDLTCTVQWVYAGQDQNNCFIRSWH